MGAFPPRDHELESLERPKNYSTQTHMKKKCFRNYLTILANIIALIESRREIFVAWGT